MSLLFPGRCPSCMKIQPKKNICGDCAGFVRVVSGDVCKKCGREKQLCTCKKENIQREYDSVIAAFYYEGTVRQIVHNLKFYKCESAALFLSDQMIKRFCEICDPNDYDYIIPVPDYPSARRYKGYSHTRYLSERLSRKAKIPICHKLKKVINNKKQHTLSPVFRSGNVAGVYEADEKCIAGKRILLIDDVITTGCTANECAKTLKIRGAKEVTVFVAALTLPDRLSKNCNDEF